MESGEKEIRVYMMPLSISTGSITLGVNGFFTAPGRDIPSSFRLIKDVRLMQAQLSF